MTLTIDLTPTEQDHLQAQARQQGLTLEGYVQTIIARVARRADPLALRTLPREERNHCYNA